MSKLFKTRILEVHLPDGGLGIVAQINHDQFQYLCHPDALDRKAIQDELWSALEAFEEFRTEEAVQFVASAFIRLARYRLG